MIEHYAKRTLAEKESELLGEQLVLGKAEAAVRQLHTAIDLFFATGDAVSVHTLVAAAHGVLRDQGLAAGIKKSFKDTPLIQEEQRASFINAVHSAQNFFKHASNDSTGQIAFKYKLTPLYLLDAIFLWSALGNELTHHMRVFIFWSQAEFPDLVCYQPAEQDIQKLRESLRGTDELLQIARELLKSTSER